MMESYRIHQDNARIFGFKICEKFLALLLEDFDGKAYLGMVNPSEHGRFLQDILRGYFSKELPYCIIDKKFFYGHLKFLSFQERQLEIGENIQELFYLILKEAIVLQASDIHLESFGEDAWLRMRIDGELEEVCRIPRKIFESLCTKIKLEAKLDITQIKQAQDGRYQAFLEHGDYDFRISCVPLYQGDSIVLRILYRHRHFTKLHQLGFLEHQLKQIQQGIAKTHGIIFITGPTGSGKSTTLYAILQALQGSGKKIITLEDPIEYHMDYATQVQVMPEADFGYAKALRAVLRQDPDILMVGEIRDEETLRLAFRAALTGHLVLATIHANDVQNTFDRLQNMGMQKHDILSCVLMIIAQRLLKKICPFCMQERFGSLMAYGCVACNQQGSLGREIISEILVLDKKTRGMIKQGELGEYLESEAFENLQCNAMQKIKEGKILATQIQKI